MARRLFTILPALSLLLCVAVVVLWVRSYWRHDTASCWRGRYACSFGSSGGAIVLSFPLDYYRNMPPGVHYHYHAFRQSPGRTMSMYRAGRPGVLGVAWYYDPPRSYPYDNRDGVTFRVLVFPHALLAGMLFILPLAWAVSARRRRQRVVRLRLGRCASCGYDLRATPGRCPECGTAALP